MSFPKIPSALCGGHPGGVGNDQLVNRGPIEEPGWDGVGAESDISAREFLGADRQLFL